MESRITKISLIICLLFACSLIVSVQVSSQTITLWTDAEQSHCEFYSDSANVAFDIYVVLETGPDGAFAAEYQVGLPDNHYLVSDEPAPFIAQHVVFGVPIGAPGISAPFLSCQTGTVVVWRMTCAANDTEPAQYWLSPYETTDFFGIAICSDPRPLVTADTYNCFGYNEWCGCSAGLEDSSWGAIKEMYR